MNLSECKVVSLIGCKVKMRDGISLNADVYLPFDRLGTPLPCRLSFSPYGQTTSRQSDAISYCCQKGFVCVYADCRGRFGSEGSFHPWLNNFNEDAWDLLEWISTREWCNGAITMIGGSYPGATQLASLRSGHPALKAVAPSAVTLDPYPIYYANGAQVLKFVSSWHINIGTPFDKAPEGSKDFLEAIKEFPLAPTDTRMGHPSPSWQNIIHCESRDDFWNSVKDNAHLKDSKAGIFYQGSWFDMLGVQTFETFKTLLSEVTDETKDSPRKYSCLRVGPWGHGVNTHEGDIDYGPEAMVTEEPEIDFLESIVNGQVPKTEKNPTKIQIFTMGRNKWRFIEEWPIPGTKYTPLYFTQNKLSFEKPTRDAPPSTYDYDPLNPVPTHGGRMVNGGGQKDQTEIEERPDVLTFTGEELTEEVEVTGALEAELYVSSSAPDTDFTVKLVDVFPDGRPFNVCDGIIRAKWRDGLQNPPRLLKKGEIATLHFFVDVTSYAFLKGHKIRVEISSSNFPHFSRNTNTGTTVADEANPVVAHQTFFHDPSHPSHLILPIIPNA